LDPDASYDYHVSDQGFGRFKRVTYAACTAVGIFAAHNLAGLDVGLGVLIILVVFCLAIPFVATVGRRRPGHEHDRLRDLI
jgi:hypothetical protein